jgi:hypothetical protein
VSSRQRATFVILANADGLSRWRGLGDKANVTASPAATLFMNCQLVRPCPNFTVSSMPP